MCIALFIPVILSVGGGQSDLLPAEYLDNAQNCMSQSSQEDCQRAIDETYPWGRQSTAVGTTLLNFSICEDEIYGAAPSFSMSLSGGILGEHNTNSLYLTKKLDYETMPRQTTSDVKINNHHVLTINITIEDADDQGIAFNKSVFNCDIAENDRNWNGPLFTNCKVQAYDLDTGINEPIDYALLSVTPNADNLFDISSGSLKLLKALDREKIALYYLGVKGFQRNNHNHENFTIVKVNVTDVDDNLPEMLQQHYNVSVLENSLEGTVVCKVLATDKDIGENAALRYVIKGTSSYFSINSSTGFVTIKKPIDREKLTSSSLTFEVYAESVLNPNRKSNSSTVSVSVEDENDNSPNISAPVEKAIQKTMQVGSEIMQINVLDPDEGVNGNIECSISPTSVPFNITTSGKVCEISLKESLNETQQLQYNFVLGVHDMATDVGKRRYSSASLTVNITDENIHPPEFGSFVRSLNVSESAKIGTILVILSASDKDPTDKLTFNITSNADYFELSANRLVLKQSLDREIKGSYSIQITVSDGKHINKTTISLTVLDVNDNVPEFEKRSYTFKTPEESNQTVGNVTATDKDLENTANSEIEYSIDTESQWYNNVTVNKTSGTISASSIDREKLVDGDQISFFVFARDNGSPVLTSRAFVTITIEDINDNRPKFEKSSVSIKVVEETPVQNLSNIYTVKASDPDIGQNGLVSYKIREQQTPIINELFRIDNTSGVISMKKSPIIENCNDRTYTLTVIAFNPSDMNKNDTTIVTCIIEDINNQEPMFSPHNHLKMREMTIKKDDVPLCYNNREIHTSDKCNYAAAVDQDCLSEYSTLFYWMDDIDYRFKIDPTTGIISIKNGSVIDYDDPQRDRQFNFTIHASDTKFNSSTILTLDVLNRPDTIPAFIKEVYTCHVKENTTVPFHFCFLNVSNVLDINTRAFKYHVEGSQDFTVTPPANEIPQLILNNSLDYEEMKGNTTIQLLVTSRRRNPPGQVHSSCKVIINIENVNDNPPRFENDSYNFSILENYKKGYVVGNVRATDADHLGALNYTFHVSDYLSFADGLLVLKKEPDLDNQTLVSPIETDISVFDGNYNTTAKITVTVKPVNEYKPVFNESSYHIDITENQKHNLSIEATDDDAGTDGIIVNYTAKIPEKWQGNVTLNNNRIIVLGFDREVMGSSGFIQFTVEAIDGGNPARTGMALVTINVSGINDNAPVFPPEMKHITLYLNEGTNNNVIHTSKADDNDVGDGSEIFYRLKKNHNGFKIDYVTGEINTDELFITEQNRGLINLTVEAYNDNNNTATDLQYINVVLNDINNYKPEFINNTFRCIVNECEEPGGRITSVTAVDNDTSVEYNTVSYWIEESYSDTFRIDSESGIIYLTRSVDFDAPINQKNFNLSVYAIDDLKKRDTSSNHTSKATVFIDITGCNDNAPRFVKAYKRCSIKENTSGTFSCSLEANDADGDRVSYTLTSGILSQNFSLVPGTGAISVLTPFDFDTLDSKEFTLNVSASDGNHTSYATVIVEVVDVNDEKPIFEKSAYTFDVAENITNVPYFVGSVKVSDADSTFNLSINKPCEDFVSISSRGDITALKPFDYEKKISYQCQILAKDTPESNVTKEFTIRIKDINDNAPVFNETQTSIAVNETILVGTSVILVSASDADITDNDVTYSIFGGNEKKLFKISPENGTVTSNQSLVNHGGKTVSLIIAATDNGSSPLTSYTRLTIRILNENINPPIFEQLPYFASVKENNGTVQVLKVFASDGDGDSLTFTVLNHTDVFHFNNSVLHATGLDAEKLDGKCYVKIQVSDDDFNTSATVDVTVVDVNDNAPVFVNGTVYNLTLNDTAVAGQNVLNIEAYDSDITNTGFTFILEGGKGDFRINASSGQLKLIRGFGRNGKIYKMSVLLTDHGNPPKSSNASIEVNVRPTNTDWHLNEEFAFSFTENSKSVQSSLAEIADTDIDYEIISDNKLKILHMFHLDTSTGLLTIANETNLLDYEKQSEYHFEVRALDRAVFPRNLTANVTISVTDVNEAPTITKYDEKVFIQANTSAKSFISKVEAFDPDKNDRLSFSLSDTKNFTVDTDGNITVKAGILEEGNYTLTVTVEDKDKLTDSKIITVIVPVVEFLSPDPYNVFENTRDFISNVTASKLTYTIIPSSYSDHFMVAKNGSLMLMEALDREIIDTVHLHIHGRDMAHGILIQDIKIVINVKDKNDCPPEFLSSNYTLTIDDIVANDTTIANIEAVDRDVNEENRNLSYNVVGNSDIFSMDETMLKVHNSFRLVPQQYRITVNVTDGIFKNSTSVLITVVDTNNHSPKFFNSSYNFDITETDDIDVLVGTVTADDQDLNENGAFTFTITSRNEDSFFEVNGTTGEIKTVNAIDREYKDKYILTLAATDHGKSPRKSTCTVTVSVLDVNDNHPEFRGIGIFEAAVKENLKNHTSIAVVPTIGATDNDFGTNGTTGIIYKLNDSIPFCMNETIPDLYVCGDLDRETKDIYYLEVIALDSYGNNGSLSTSARLIIHVLDVNDETPKFTQDVYKFSVHENPDKYINIGNVSATDADSGGNKYLKYNIISGDDGKFYVDTFLGMIYVGGDVDREKTSTFTLNVSVSDGRHTNYTTVEISIIDVNDNPPQFANEKLIFQDAINVNVEEETQSGVILNATAYDNDESNSSNSNINYTLTISDSGFGTDFFYISEDGFLNLTKPLNREKRDQYVMKITATDNGNPSLSSTLLVHVHVLDINDNSPMFCVGKRCGTHEANCSTVEKAPVNSVLILLGSTDSDFGVNASVSYSVEESAVSKYFKIDKDTGVVSVADALVVNNLIQAGMQHSNATAEVILIITATDGGGLNTTLTLHVFVEPINDDDVPVFSESVFKFNVTETNETGVIVGSCLATKNDTHSHMTYELISGYGEHSGTFRIDNSAGVVTTTAAIDREKTDKYIFAVQVRDGRVPERTAFAAVEITIGDVNDNRPGFINDNITISVLENSTIYKQASVAATDSDQGLNAEITYRLQNNYSSLFNIDENGTLTINGTFDYEQVKRYEILVLATDKGSPPMNSTAEVHIAVTDANDNSPVFENMAPFYNITENHKPSKIFTVNATDADSRMNGEVVYKLQNIEDVPFGIDPLNGNVYLQGGLDYETKTYYTLTIVAHDLGSPSLSTTADVTVYIEDVYDDKIKFKKDIFDIDVTPTTSLTKSLLNLTVSVPKAYFSLEGKDSEYFSIGNMTGRLFLAKRITADRQFYLIQVIAKDGHGQNTSCMVVAHVKGHVVTFNTSEIKLDLRENINETSILVDLNTTAELSGNGVEYTMVNVTPAGRDLFAVDRTTGVVKCQKPLDREEHAQYTILISAQTSSTRRKRELPRPSSIIRIVVNVNDENDNPPHFSSDQERVFGVPDNVRANYIVGKIQAEDLDISDVGKLRYNVTGGRTDVFGVNRETGEIRTLVAIASTKSNKFNLSISVSDGNILNKKATINITINVVPTKDQPMLTLDMEVDEFNKRKDAYRRNMSDILGVTIQFEKVEAHRETDSNGVTHVDLSRADLIFHGFNRSSGGLVPNKKMNELINDNIKELAKLFGQKDLSVSHVILDVIADPSAISATQILFICMAVFIFFGSLAALIVAQYSWTRYETERREAEKEDERLEHDHELSTIRSRQSSKLSSVIAAAATNPAYVETEFVTSSGQLSQKMKDEPQYESQELRVNFDEEPLDAFLNAQGLGNATQSVIDSGVGNTSVHSEGNRQGSSSPGSGVGATERHQPQPQLLDVTRTNEEGPVMTSSPRVSRVEDKVAPNESLEHKDKSKTDSKEVKDLSVDQGKRSRAASLILLDATGESETDDTVDDTEKATTKSDERHVTFGTETVVEGVSVDGGSVNEGDVITKDGDSMTVGDEDMEAECTSF